MSDWLIGGIAVPEDLEWPDERKTQLTRRQSETLSLSGGVIVQVSRQTGGLPITIQTPADHPVRRSLCESLQDHADDDATGAFTVTDPSGNDYQCRYRWRDGDPVEWSPLYHQSPPDPDDYCTLTLRLMTV